MDPFDTLGNDTQAILLLVQSPSLIQLEWRFWLPAWRYRLQAQTATPPWQVARSYRLQWNDMLLINSTGMAFRNGSNCRKAYQMASRIGFNCRKAYQMAFRNGSNCRKAY